MFCKGPFAIRENDIFFSMCFQYPSLPEVQSLLLFLGNSTYYFSGNTISENTKEYFLENLMSILKTGYWQLLYKSTFVIGEGDLFLVCVFQYLSLPEILSLLISLGKSNLLRGSTNLENIRIVFEILNVLTNRKEVQNSVCHLRS